VFGTYSRGQLGAIASLLLNRFPHHHSWQGNSRKLGKGNSLQRILESVPLSLQMETQLVATANKERSFHLYFISIFVMFKSKKSRKILILSRGSQVHHQVMAGIPSGSLVQVKNIFTMAFQSSNTGSPGF
jgi:hypothetical protein